MGSTKQLKLWPTPEGQKPLICAAYDSIRPICDDMVVVFGHDSVAVRTVLGDRPFHSAESSATVPMFESIRAGLRIASSLAPQGTVVLQPADHPEVQATTLETLKASSLERPEQAIIPQHAGRGGHPVLIPANIVAKLIAVDCPTGLGQFWLDHPELCCRVPVDDATIHRDIDTPADLPG